MDIKVDSYIAAMRHFLFSSALILSLLGCSGNSDQFLDAVELSRLELESLSISSLRNRSQRDETLSYFASALLKDGSNTDFSSRVSWKTSDPAIATIDNSGKLTANLVGEITVTASFANLSASSQLTINDATLEALKLTASGNVNVCRDEQLGATGSYSDGSERQIRDLVDWSLSNIANASIITSGASKGTITVTEPSNAISVNLSKGAASDTALVLVDDTLESISVTATETATTVNSELQFKATGKYSGTIADSNITGNVNWVSSSTGVATINSLGLLKAVAAGATNITASCGGKTSTASALTVTDGSKDQLQFVFSNDVVTSITRSDDSDFNLILQSVSSAGTTTDRTEDATWTIRSSDDTVDVSVNDANNSKGELTISGTGSFIVQAVYDNTTIILPIEIESTLNPPSAPG